MVMKRAGIAELKAHLSEHLAAVRAGDELLVTDRGRPVAKLVPLEADEGSAEDERVRLRGLERAGIVHVGSGSIPTELLDGNGPADPDASARATLLEERASGP